MWAPNNAALVARAAAGFEVSTVLTTVAEKVAGSYGLGIIYAKTMFGASEGH